MPVRKNRSMRGGGGCGRKDPRRRSLRGGGYGNSHKKNGSGRRRVLVDCGGKPCAKRLR